MNEQEILKQRAAKIAQKKTVAEETIDVIAFYLGNEKFAIEPQYIKEVYPIKDPVAIPGLPDYFFGIINVRRKIISIIDLKKIFKIIKESIDEPKVIILENSSMELGILADEMIGMIKINPEELQIKLPTLTGIRQKYLKGVTLEPLTLLDGDKILNDKDLIIHEEIKDI